MPNSTSSFKKEAPPRNVVCPVNDVDSSTFGILPDVSTVPLTSGSTSVRSAEGVSIEIASTSLAGLEEELQRQYLYFGTSKAK